jgi:predicted kinase
MLKVILLRGLPGSGKSTYAKSLIDANPNIYKRINRDDMRMMFDNSKSSKSNEKFVKKIRNLLIIEALKDNKNVIVDDTNLSDTNYNSIKQLVEQFNKENKSNVSVEIKEMEASLSECIERDKNREKKVGEKVIRQMYRQFYEVKTHRYQEQDINLPKALISDLDGTLAILNGRDPYIAIECENDELNIPVANVVKNYKNLGYKIILFSGRFDTYKEQTINWLKKHEIDYDMLVMRPANDNRKDSLIKFEFYNEYVKNKYYIEFVLDDRNQVVNMWRDELKLACFQVYYGDF